RHTCASIGSTNSGSVNISDSKAPSVTVPNNGLMSSGRQVSFREPCIEESEESIHELGKVNMKYRSWTRLILIFRQILDLHLTHRHHFLLILNLLQHQRYHLYQVVLVVHLVFMIPGLMRRKFNKLQVDHHRFI